MSALNKNDIIEIKTFSKPPALVQLTMEGVCILLQARRGAGFIYCCWSGEGGVERERGGRVIAPCCWSN